MEVTLGYLDEERVKLWTELNNVKKALDEAVAKLSQTDKATVSSIQSLGQSLEGKIAVVKKIANEKTPEDVQTASRAAQEVVKIKNEVQALQKDTEEHRVRLTVAKNALKRIQGISDNCDVANKEVESSRAKIAEATKSIDSYLAQLGEKKVAIDDMFNRISAATTSSVEKSQEVANLKAQVGNATSEVSAARQRIQELRVAFDELKERQDAVFSASKETLGDLNSANQSRFDSLYTTSEKRIKKLEDYINKLLPGATSLSLSSAFESRKTAVEKNKWWWATLLIVSALSIVCFGMWSLHTISTTQTLSAVPIRIVIIAGLVIIEEFARRNYNVSSRLAEAYAYKEAIAQSYVGFKKELVDIDLPPRRAEDSVKSIAVLADTFLQKIGDEPGKKVFDKERPALGVVQAISRISGQDEPSTESKAQIVATATTFLSRVSWPIVALVTVLAVAGCIITWLVLRG